MGMGSVNSKGSRVVMSEINVTPLVDVMLVLLIIFMVTAPMLQQGLEVELPETKSSGVATPEDPFVVTIRKDRKIFFGTTQVPMGEIKTRLNAIFETRSRKQVFIQADRAVDYGVVAETMAEVRAAGIFNIGLITVPKSSL